MKIRIAIFYSMITLLGFTILSGANKNDVKIFVLDNFHSSSHGENIVKFINCWSIKSCKIKKYPTNLRVDDYLVQLLKINEAIAARKGKKNIVNISLGFSDNFPIHEELINEMTNNGAIVIAASGNKEDKYEKSKLVFPAGFTNVVSVAAASRRGSIHKSYIKKVDIAVRVRDQVTRYTTQEIKKGLPVKYEHRDIRTGTSLAAGKLSGICGLIWGNHDWTREQLLEKIYSECNPSEIFPRRSGGNGFFHELSALRKYSLRTKILIIIHILSYIIMTRALLLFRKEYITKALYLTVSFILLIPVYLASSPTIIYFLGPICFAALIVICRLIISLISEGELKGYVFCIYGEDANLHYLLAKNLEREGARVCMRTSGGKPEYRSIVLEPGKPWKINYSTTHGIKGRMTARKIKKYIKG